MKFLAPGLRELVRLGQRLAIRFQLLRVRRKLARCEMALGLLAWQQADYDAVTQRHVSRLLDCERDQVRLTNESAAHALEIDRLEKERGTKEREFSEACGEALAREMPGATSEVEIETTIATKRRTQKEMEGRVAVLTRELAAAEAQYSRLVAVDAPAPQVSKDLSRLRKVILSLTRERAEWEAKGRQIDEEIAALTNLRRSLGEARGSFEKGNRALAGKIAELQRARRRLEKEIEGMERAKADPYREIGRTLADCGVGSLNQPEALASVLRQRAVIGTCETSLAASLEASAGEVRAAVWQAWLVLATALLVLSLAVIIVVQA